MEVRIRRMVSSSVVMAPRIRSVIGPGSSRVATACRVSPAANMLWMTWSCRSAAIRSRSANITAFCCSARASASSMAIEAWLAKPAAISRSSAVNAGRPDSRATVSTP